MLLTFSLFIGIGFIISLQVEHLINAYGGKKFGIGMRFISVLSWPVLLFFYFFKGVEGLSAPLIKK